MKIIIIFCGFLISSVTAIYNVGIIATDDYYNGVAVMIPAQNQKPLEVVARSTHNPPLTRFLLMGLAQLGYQLGLETPIYQLRFSLFVLGLFSFWAQLILGMKCFQWSKNQFAHETMFAFLFGFYFASPLFLSRPLVESVCMPFLTASSFFVLSYWHTQKISQLLIGLFVLSLASMLRYSVGVLVVIPVLLILHRQQWRHFVYFVASGVALFFMTGWLDSLYTGEFHRSLKSYLNHNFYHGGELYGKMPFYSFVLLFLGLSLPPTFLGRFRSFEWKKTYSPLLPLLLLFIFFVFTHSLAPHKEERFMIPLLTMFLILLCPLAVELCNRRSWNRITYFLVLNTVLLVSVSFNIPQWNIIGMALFINKQPNISRIVGIENTLVVYPDAFIGREVTIENKAKNVFLAHEITCRDVVAARASLQFGLNHTTLKKIAEFYPGWIEGLIVKLNPAKNERRGKIELYMPTHCSA